MGIIVATTSLHCDENSYSILIQNRINLSVGLRKQYISCCFDQIRRNLINIWRFIFFTILNSNSNLETGFCLPHIPNAMHIQWMKATIYNVLKYCGNLQADYHTYLPQVYF
jgi:hypothetical protein